jgi:hypothetical protein
MNAGRDVERLVAHWLVEEAEVRAPDRVLDSTRRTIDRTGQRRLIAAWRGPMYLSSFKIATAAAVVAIALIGAAYFGGTSLTPGVGGSPSAAPTFTADPNTAFIAYREARDEICERYVATTNPLRPEFEEMYAAADTPAERAPKIAALAAFAGQFDAMIDELAQLETPDVVARDHAADVARFEAEAGLIHSVVDRLNAGDLAGAKSLDDATNAISREIERFETRNVLSHCP